jgi:ABC-type branched-subunit amino acid transport system substrate-binding protein
MDDAIDPKRTVENTKKLIHEKNVFALFLYRGTPNVEAVLPIIEQERVPLVGPSSGAQSMYDPPKRYLFPVRASYQAEADKLIEYVASNGMTRVAVLHEDASFGADVLASVKRAAQKNNTVAVSAASYPRGTTNVQDAAKTIAKTQPEAVILVGQANALAQFIKEMKILGSSPRYLALSNVGSIAFFKTLGSDARGIAITQITPYPYSVSCPLAKDFLRAIKEEGYEPSYLAMEGFIAAKVLTEGLRRASKEPTREKLIAALEGMDRYDLGGVEVTYNGTTHSGSSFAEITMMGKDGRFLH